MSQLDQLTLYQEVLSFNISDGESLSKTLWREKREMLAASTFSLFPQFSAVKDTLAYHVVHKSH